MSDEIELPTDLPPVQFDGSSESPNGKDYSRTGLWAQLKIAKQQIELLKAESEEWRMLWQHACELRIKYCKIDEDKIQG